ncbi:MAG: N-acetylmuramoyl-L-alanine amidase [Clostridia bacterium]|nr:N-acetylmuramoyl-L-alanine amidase [Clostridia bacterium]
MKRFQKQIHHNRSVRNTPIRYIVIHDTGNTSPSADAQSHYRFFHSANRGSSADIFVDDHSVWYVNDYTKYYTWHCGDGKGKYGITNQNSIGVELCINTGGDYEKAMRTMATVVRKLMAELGIPRERVVRHYDASRKNCPGSMRQSDWAMWHKFQTMLKKEEQPMIYNYIDENMPAWARESVQWAVDNGIIQGDGNGLALTDDKLWFLVVLKRALTK